MKLPKFTCSKYETSIAAKIARRAVELAGKHGVDYSQMDALMDIEACHCNGCALDLEGLLAAPDFDFAHDVFGIRRHIDRSSGELTGCFVPRFATGMAFAA